MPWKSIVDKISCRRLSNRPQFVVCLKAILKLIISEYCENIWHRLHVWIKRYLKISISWTKSLRSAKSASKRARTRCATNTTAVSGAWAATNILVFGASLKVPGLTNQKGFLAAKKIEHQSTDKNHTSFIYMYHISMLQKNANNIYSGRQILRTKKFFKKKTHT